ncbi:type II toxin-antitoxin system HigB family toxin [Singulisphaera rosea]
MMTDAKNPKNRLISRRKVREFLTSHPGANQDRDVLFHWCKLVEASDWRNFGDVRSLFASADQVGERVIFNVGANKYRFIAQVRYRKDNGAKVLLRWIGTHREYDRLNR